MSGTEYRCIVSQTNMKTEKSSVVYSNTVKLTVDKASSTTELGTSRTGGNATHETTVETKKTVTAEYKQGNATYQKYKNAYTEDDKITGDVFGGSDSTGYHYYTGLTAGAESNANGVYTVSGTAVPLTAATDRITLDGKAYEISDKGFKRTPKAEEINGTTYTVYTATGVAGESGKTETLTLYRKDDKYYRKNSDSTTTEMTAANTIGDAANTYRKDSLTPVYVTEGDYTVLTYTTEDETPTTLTIYERNGTYYSKNGNTYTSLSLVTGLYQNGEGKLFKPGAAVTTEITVSGSKEQVKGEPVTLTANVNVTDTGAAANGTVTFEITNTTTGSVTRQQVSKSPGDPKVSYSWTPSEAGVYSIVAIFGGNSETAASRSGAVTYYAKAADDLYEIEVRDCTYGETISPSLKSVTISNGSGSASGADKSVTYAAYKVGATIAVADWESGKTLVPGTYRITATADDKLLASKYITVSKKPITITAPTAQDGQITFTDKDGNPGFVIGDNYTDLFKTEGMPTDKTAGVYNVSVVYDESIPEFTNKQAEFFSKYTPTLKSSMVLVKANAYTVTYSNGNNGTLKGYQGDYSTSFNSGAQIASGSNVIFTATPEENYQVWKWTVNGVEVTKSTDDYTLSDDKKTLTISSLNGALDVQVEFSNQFYTVSALSNDGNGTVTATVGGVLTAGYVLSGTEVTFTAAPKTGYVVKQWTVKRGTDASEPQKNTDGTVFSGNELKLTITANTTVSVTFEQTAQFTVHYSAVEFSNQFYTVSALSNDGNGTVTATVGGVLTAGYVLSGTEVTFTAAPKTGYVVKQWTVKRGTDASEPQKNTDGTVFSGNELKLTITANTTVSVTFEQTAQFTVHYSAVDQKNTDKIVALSFETTGLTEGKGEKGSTVTLTAKPSSAMGIAGWQYKTKPDGDWSNTSATGLSYTIRNLQCDIWVRALVNDSATPTKVSFGIVNEKNPSVAGGGTLTAKYTANGAEIQSGNGCTTYSSITFTYEEPTAYEVVGWKVNGNEVAAVRNGKTFTYTIDSLTTATTVNMVVRPKPTVAITPPESPEIGTFSVTYTLKDKEVKPEEENGTKYVYSGTKATVTATPGNNYVATDVKADWGTGNTSTPNAGKVNGEQKVEIAAITANTIFSATFVEKPKVTIETATGGTVTVKGTVNGKANTTLKTGNYVDFDTDLTVTLAPGKGYEVGDITGAAPQYTDGDGTTTDNKSYTISKVQGNQTIKPVWSAIPTTTVNWSVIDKTPNTDGGTDGTLTATVTRKNMDSYKVTDSTAGTLTVYRDSVVTFTATPETGYKTGGWQLNGEKQSSQPTLTITNDIVNTTQKVEVQFDPLGKQVTYGFQADSANAAAHKAQLTAQFKPNSGTETNFESGTTPTTDGSITFTVSGLDDGYEVEGWYVNGSKQDGETGTTFTHEVTHDVGMDVRVKIVRKSYTVNFSATNGTNAFDSGAEQPAGSTIVFTAQPKDGYQVKGWYTAADGTTAITGTTSEQNSYTITNLTDEATVYVAFEPIPTYDITLSTTGLGHVTATVNGKDAKIADGKLTVSRHDNVVLTAVPDANQYLTGWTLDGETKGNSSLSLTLDDVTEGHAVAADFAASQLVTLKTVCGANGTLTAQAGYGDALQTIDASSESGIQVEKGKKVVLTVTPGTDYMVEKWMVNGTVQDNLSNTLTIENLNENTTVAVAFETPLTLYSIPQSDKGYTVSDVKKTPNDYGNENQIRARGTVTFTVAPVSGPYLTALTVNGKNCLATISNDGNENKLTVVNNRNGSYTITVANVTKNIELTAASMKFRTEKTELSVPKELKEQYADTDARCKLVALTAEGDVVSMTLSELKALISA